MTSFFALAIFSVASFFPLVANAQTEFNPHFILSDAEMQDSQSLDRATVQTFLENKGSYLSSYSTSDAEGQSKTATDIIYDAAQKYQINPKFLLVTLQKEQSLITDDKPTQKQLDWATGYGVCDSCSMSNPSVVKHKGFGKQVDSAAGIIRWYYENTQSAFVKKIGAAIKIDKQEVVPQSWATAFLYTYTPHLHGNLNFWNIWNAWFSQVYPDGSLLKSETTGDVWMIKDGKRKKFKSMATLASRANPELIITVDETELSNYEIGKEISLPNYSILKSSSGLYLTDYDTIRRFASEETVKKLGYNPQEIIDVSDADLDGYEKGPIISVDTTAPPQGILYKISDLNDTVYLFKDNILYPLLSDDVISVNFKNLRTEIHKLKDIKNFQTAIFPIMFNDGVLIQQKDSNKIYVMEKNKKRRIADEETFTAMGYKKSNLVTIRLTTLLNIPEGETIYLNASLVSSKNKFLGDNETSVEDVYKKTKLPSYLVAEYPSGRILSGKNIDEPRSIASLTKLLTAYEMVENAKLEKTTAYDKKFASEGKTLALKIGEKVKNSDTLNAMLVNSANNLARMSVAASGSSEKEFIKLINARLKNWGADNTKITDVTGLDEKNKSTARDLLKIFTKALGNKNIKDALGKTNFVFYGINKQNKKVKHSVASTNQLINKSGRNYRIIASKTGYTDEAGSCLIMLIESRKTKKQFIVLTLGDANYAKRFDEVNKIAQWVSSNDISIASK